MNSNSISRNEMPIGLVMALSQNVDALSCFSTLSKDKQKAIIDGTHSIKSKQEMQQYVDNIPTQSFS